MSGLFASEAEIMELHDAGKSAGEIVELTGKSRRYVESVTGRYSISDRSLNAYDRMVAHGTKALLEAIARHHPERIGARP